ncbi:MAG TPA: PAS domain-containing protein [Stellaceae bacterium]|nr:PAS domain-containing protein [Stellaceae bacterium]
MAVEITGPQRRPSWPEQRMQLWWLRSLAALALALCLFGAGIGILNFARVTAGLEAQAMAVMLLAVGGVAGVAAMTVRWAHTALVGRVDILSQALDASPDAQLIIAPNGSVVYANAAFNLLFPGTDEAPLDRIARAVAADAQAQTDFRRLRDQAEAGARAIAALHLCDARGGGAGWFNISVNPVAGRSGYSFWNLQDITARHEMEAVINDERNKLVDFLDNAPIGFYSVDESGRFLLVNQILAEWLGTTAAEMIGGARLHDFLREPPEGAAPWDPFGGEDEASRRGEVVLRGRQGRVVQAWIGQSVVGAGAGLRTRSVVRDLTLEREWETARERFQRFFTNAPVGIALLDAEGRIEEANRAVGDLFDTPTQALIGRELVGFIVPEDRAEMTARFAGAGDGPLPREPLEVRLLRPRERTLAIFLSRLDETPGGEGGLILHFIDVTEQKNLQIQFAQSQKMQAVGQLAGGVAHDFNNLLTAMIGFCDLLLLRCRPGDPSFADIMQIKQNANRAANLVRQLLAFSRQQTLQPRVLDITDVLVELSHLLRRLIGENIELKVVHGRELGLAKVDQGQLEQVIINLAVNARDAMPQGGTLTIRTDNVTQKGPDRRGHEVVPPGDYLLIEVADTGVGIPKENLERIFEPFFSTKEIGSGTGLGLSTVYGIVKQTGGFVFVDSKPGRGTAFQILLPRYRSPEGDLAARPEIGEVGLSRDLTGIGTVMLVEDDDPVRIFGARALRNKGYTVIEARSGEMALELIRDGVEKIDLLITDVVMPRLDGPGLIREVREIHPGIKVIFISGYAEDEFRQRLDRDHAIHFLPKPFSLKQLAGKVKEVMNDEAA